MFHCFTSECLTIWSYFIVVYLTFMSEIVLYYQHFSTLILYRSNLDTFYSTSCSIFRLSSTHVIFNIFSLYTYAFVTWKKKTHFNTTILQVKTPFKCQLTPQVLSKPLLKSRVYSYLSICKSGCLTKFWPLHIQIWRHHAVTFGDIYMRIGCESNYMPHSSVWWDYLSMSYNGSLLRSQLKYVHDF